jgi:CheY-like chemotaxis protein
MPSNAKLLVVDDNPLVLQLLVRTLSPLGAITAAPNALDALRCASADPPDLIVSDFSMPGMNGLQMVQKIKAQPETASIPVVLLASASDIHERLKPVQDAVEDLLEKPFFAADLAARIKRILDKILLEKMARATPGETTVRGSLAQMNVIDLLQSLELGRKTCSLRLAKDNEQCQIFFREGQIHHARFGNLAGDEAVYRVLTWMEPAGSFEIDFAASSVEETTTRSTQSLLMEGLRLLDEASRDGAGENSAG